MGKSSKKKVGDDNNKKKAVGGKQQEQKITIVGNVMRFHSIERYNPKLLKA